MASTLEELVIKLTADSAALRSDLEKVTSHLKQSKKNSDELKDALKTVFSVAAIKGAAEAFASFVIEGAKAGEAMKDLAEGVGLSVEEMSRLDYAAKLTGTSSEQVAVGLVKLSKTMADAARGGEDASDAFAKMGVELKNSDGSLRSQGDVLKDIADKFAGYRGGVEKTALAQELFSKGGAGLIPLLNEGGAAIQRYKDEADALGLTLSTETAEACEVFNQQLARLETTSGSLSKSLAAELSPSLKALTDSVLKVDGPLSTILKAAVATATYLGGNFVKQVLAASFALDVFGKFVGSSGSVLANLVQGNLQGAYEALRSGKEEIGKASDDFRKSLKEVFEKPVDVDPNKLADKVVAPLLKVKDKTEKEGAAALKALQHVLDEFKAKAAGLGADGQDDPLAALTERLNFGDLAKPLRAVAKTDLGASSAIRADILAAAEAFQTLKQSTEDAKEGIAAFGVVQAALADLQAKEAALTDATNSATLATQLQSGTLGKSIEFLKGQKYAVTENIEELERLAAAIDAAKVEKEVSDAGGEARKTVLGELESLRAKQVDVAGATELSRVKLSLQNGTLAQCIDLLRAAHYDADAFANALLKDAAAADEFAKHAKAIAEVKGLADQAAGIIADSFETILFDGFDKGLDDMARGFTRLIAKLLQDAAVANLSKVLLGGGAGAGAADILSNVLVDGARASGGPVAASRSYLVGENGPELFTPSASGSILPNEALGNLNQQQRQAPTTMRVMLDGGALNMTMRDWLERELAEATARR